MLQLGGMLNKLMQFDCIIYGGLQEKPQLLGNFRNFFKKIPFYRHLDYISNVFRPVERTKLLRLGIYLKFLNCQALSVLFISRSNSNHV